MHLLLLAALPFSQGFVFETLVLRAVVHASQPALVGLPDAALHPRNSTDTAAAAACCEPAHLLSTITSASVDAASFVTALPGAVFNSISGIPPRAEWGAHAESALSFVSSIPAEVVKSVPARAEVAAHAKSVVR
eukprot:TRINITY_DN7781_c1_g1_i2.p4 TRINITY_DN7781_c1_g1~~TRINITY_DN7781_c1_g1_i2.p4  ORF type:complete len:134 (-),score=45.59 TRINITY_DN7781_c1_g1_i2:618-1019(-)